MPEELRASEVANLDPYNRSELEVRVAGEELLDEKLPKPKRRQVKEKEEAPFDLIAREKSEWGRVLGGVPNIQPLPQFITPSFVNKLAAVGLETIFMPRISTIAKGDSVPDFLNRLRDNFPNWRNYEDFTPQQLQLIDNARNLKEWYWNNLAKGKISPYNLPGEWIVVEALRAPYVSSGDSYDKFPLNKF